jgi:hypothetical protein
MRPHRPVNSVASVVRIFSPFGRNFFPLGEIPSRWAKYLLDNIARILGAFF